MPTRPAIAPSDRLRAEDLRPLPHPLAASPVDPLDFPGYAERLRALDAADPHVDESVSVGLAELGGLEVVVALGHFRFLGGSMGHAHGERVAAAMAVAREQRLPFVAITATGGARMQEGMFALVQMSRAAEGIRRLREAGIPVLSWFTNPTTGGVHASYGALADVIIADAAAAVGFAGPRVVEAVTGQRVGPDSHTAEVAFAAGLVDEVLEPETALARLTRWVGLVNPARRDGPLPATEPVEEPVTRLEAWEAVSRARWPHRPSARDLLDTAFDEHLELHGDRAGGHDDAVVIAVARLGARTVVVAGMDRRCARPMPSEPRGQPGPAGYRKVRRAAELARRWEVPLVTLIDTPGADPSAVSDRGGLAVGIAEAFVATLSVTAPTVAVVTGEGGSGGALALGCTDQLLLQDDAVFEVIAPEGAASILHRDTSRAREVAALLRPTAGELRELGIVDRVLPGPTTADPATAAAALRAGLVATLRELDAEPDRLARRRARYGPGAVLDPAQ